MSYTLFRVEIGEVGQLPGNVKMSSDNILSEIVEAGYVANDGQVLPTDIIAATYPGDDGSPALAFFDPIFENGIITLTPMSGGGGTGVSSVTGTANRIAVNNTDPAHPVVDIENPTVMPGDVTINDSLTLGIDSPGISFATEETAEAPASMYATSDGTYNYFNFSADNLNFVGEIGVAFGGAPLNANAGAKILDHIDLQGPGALVTFTVFEIDLAPLGPAIPIGTIPNGMTFIPLLANLEVVNSPDTPPIQNAIFSIGNISNIGIYENIIDEFEVTVTALNGTQSLAVDLGAPSVPGPQTIYLSKKQNSGGITGDYDINVTVYGYYRAT